MKPPEVIVEAQIDALLVEVEKSMDGDAITFCGPITYGADDLLRDELEAIKPKRDRLVVILETNGGYIEVAQRFADLFRHHYKIVDFVVPNSAMSAGTVLVMSGDAIHMDHYSILGPIDPHPERNWTVHTRSRLPRKVSRFGSEARHHPRRSRLPNS